MTKQEKLVVSAYTGILMTTFSEFHDFVEKQMSRPVYTHEFADKEFTEELKASVKEDFLKLCSEEV